MGWCSATHIFDDAVEAAYKLQDATKQADNEEDERKAFVDFAKKIRDILEAGDWDCQQESDFYQDLKWDLWPRYAQEDEELEEDD